jgi:predicted nucleic-acid-binding Zn-ribbon protein
MKRTNRCPKCDSTNIIGNATAIDRSHYNAEEELSVATYRNPRAFIFQGKRSTSLSAWVCAECGYTEFYADSPQKIDPSMAK